MKITTGQKLWHKRDGDHDHRWCAHEVFHVNAETVTVPRACHGVSQPDRQQKGVVLPRRSLEEDGEAAPIEALPHEHWPARFYVEIPKDPS